MLSIDCWDAQKQERYLPSQLPEEHTGRHQSNVWSTPLAVRVYAELLF